MTAPSGSACAVPFTADLARSTGAKIVVAHIEEEALRGGPLHVGADETRADVERQAEELKATGLDVTLEAHRVMLGGPAQAISALAEQVDADLIVTGTTGRSQIAGLVLGSVPQRLLHVAGRPVLAVPAPTRTRG